MNETDGGLDRDAAAPLELEGVGLRRAVVDAADRRDDAGGEEQPLGEGGLTGVYMRQDSEVQRADARVMSFASATPFGMDMYACRMRCSSLGGSGSVQQNAGRAGNRFRSRAGARSATPQATAARCFCCAYAQPGPRSTYDSRSRHVVDRATSRSMSACSCVATRAGLNVSMFFVRP